MEFLKFGTKSCLKVWQKKCIITKSSYNCSKYMKNVKMLGHSSTPPRGQGQFHNGNSAGTVSSTGFLKIFAYEFGTKSCLRVLQRLNIINKSTKTCSKCKKMQKSRALQHCPLSQGQFYYGFSMVIPLGQFFLVAA